MSVSRNFFLEKGFFGIVITSLYGRVFLETMYAIIQAGSRQFRVKKGDVIHVDLLDAQPGQEVDLGSVLFLSQEDGAVTLGNPTVSGCVVKAKYVAEVKGPKITSLKYKKRKNEYRKFGHRQRYAQVEIVSIQA